MPGSATLGTNLVDELVTDIDDLRDELHTEFGVRHFRVWTVLRTWSTGIIGEGDYTDTETEITPQPLVESWLKRTSGLRWTLEPCGIDEAGFVFIKEISFTYTYNELTGGTLNGAEWFIKLTDAHGQEYPDIYFIVKRPPYPDRINDLGWIMELERIGAET